MILCMVQNALFSDTPMNGFQAKKHQYEHIPSLFGLSVCPLEMTITTEMTNDNDNSITNIIVDHSRLFETLSLEISSARNT